MANVTALRGTFLAGLLRCLVDSHLKPLLFPTADTGFLIVTYFGELVFMGWLLWEGWRVELAQESTRRHTRDEGA